MKATPKAAAPKVIAAKPAAKSETKAAVPAKKLLTAAQRSEVSRRAAQAAWRTMHSKAYQSAAKKSPAAVQSYLANRKTA
jgi:hypothetical protein